MAGGDDFVDERRPVVRPFLFEDRDKDEIQLVEQNALISQALFSIRCLDDEFNDEVANTYLFQCRPSKGKGDIDGLP